jgi:hypothetical protein
VSSDEHIDRLLEQAAQPGDAAGAACLDGESLAAYMDGGLSPDQRALAEAHIADCARCLQMTAAMLQTDLVAVHEPRRSWFRTGWLVPLTAAAVGMAAWLIVRDPRGLETPAVQEAISTRTPAEAAPPLLPSESSKATVPEFRQERKASPDSLAKSETLSDRARAGNRATEDKRESGATTVPPPRADTAATAQAAPPAAPPTLLSAEQAAALARDGLTSARGIAPPLQVVATPDPAVRWRFSASAVEKTTDGGATWIPQTTGATGFVAGAAPSAEVFWLAGRNGLVLLTTDGRTWRRIDLPDPSADALTITAADARSATVTTAAGRTYRTTDAGVTWTLQEIPAAPF